MKNVFAILFVAGLAAVCFGQVDSADMPVKIIVREHLKPIDTNVSWDEFYRNTVVHRNEVYKLRAFGSGVDNEIFRQYEARKKSHDKWRYSDY